jgi:hypothetical protein
MFSDPLGDVEPISALLAIVGAYGVNVVVKALTGSSELGGVAAELFKALAQSESRIDERLSAIGNLLDELLEQRYSAELATGVRYFLDAAEAASGRITDLERSRHAFIEARSAARSPLQEAIAERYVLLSLLALGRMDLVQGSLIRMEAAATAAIFEAMALTEFARDYYEAVLRGDPSYSISDPPQPRPEAQAAALESIGMCGRLLGEAAALAPAVALPPRATPPAQLSEYGQLERKPDPRPVRAAARLASRFDKPERADPVQASMGDSACWTFDIRPEEVLRIGSLTLRVSVNGSVNARSPGLVARLGLSAPLPRPIVMHWIHAEYEDHGNRVSALFRPNPGPGVPKPPPRPKLPPIFLGWQPGRSPAGIEIDSGAIEAELLMRPVAEPASAGPLGRRHLDPSKSAVRLNPVYTYRHFIVVTTPTLGQA